MIRYFQSQAIAAKCAGTMVLLMALASSATAAAQPAAQNQSPWREPSDQPAEMLPLAPNSVLLAATVSDTRRVAVGERGHVLLSSDGKHWKQAASVPTRSTLTAVAAIGTEVWAVGHDGVIIHSADGGEHWQLQRRDPLQKAVKANDEAGANPRQGAPLLSVLFLDAHIGYAVGAYSLMLATSDGGVTWTPVTVNAKKVAGQSGKKEEANKENWSFSKEELQLEQETDPHLNAIAVTGDGSLFIAAERGTVFRSRDAGKTWQRLQLPYSGSMFGVLGYAGQHVLVYGLRGHAFESSDLGDHWSEINTGTELTLLGGTKLPDDGAVLAGANGVILLRSSRGAAFQTFVDPGAGAITAALPETGAHAFVIASENGVTTFTLPQ